MSPVLLIARREITSRLQQKGFRIGLAVTVVIIALAALVPRLLGGNSQKSYDIAVSGTRGAEVATALRSVAETQNVTVKLHAVGADEARAKVRAGDWDVAVIDDAQIVAKSADSQAVAIVQVAHQSLQTLSNLVKAGLDEKQVRAAFNVAPLSVSTTGSSANTQRQVIATVVVVLLFGQLIGFCTWIAMGVVEEKSSRVVELVLAAVRPVQLLGGKLLGIGALAVGQVLLLAAVALGVSTAAGTLDIPGSAAGIAAMSFGWFLLGFAFFAALSAALASLVSRQEEVSGVLTPVTTLLFVAYLGSFAVAGAPDSTAARIASIVPPISAIAMPARIARGGVPAADMVLAVVLMVSVTAAIVLVAARIYRAAILHTGSRLTIRKAWRSEAVAEIA